MQEAPLVGVGVVVLKDGHVLLIRRGKAPRKGEWSLPGGRQELGETVRDTARREVLEETGITCEVTSLLDVIDMITRVVDGNGEIERHYTLVDFAADWVSGEPVAGDDASEAVWYPLHKVEELGLWAETMRVIKMAEALSF